MNRIEQRNNQTKPAPRKSQDETIEELLDAKHPITTYAGEQFVFIPDSKEFVVITCKTNLEMMCNEKVVLMGDRVKSFCPNLFYHIYVIHGYCGGINVKFITFLVNSKRLCSYISIWSYVTEICQSFGLCFDPKTFRVDNIQKSYTAFKQIFPNCEIHICRICVLHSWKKTLNDQKPFTCGQHNFESPEINDWLKRFFGLPFSHPNDVSESFIQLISEAPSSSNALMKFPDYILNKYIGETHQDDALFPPYMWAYSPSYSDRNITGDLVFHQHLNKEYNYSNNKTIWHVLTNLKDKQIIDYDKIRRIKLLEIPSFVPEENSRFNFNIETYRNYLYEFISRMDYLFFMGYVYQP